jgi:hypothetical protein
MDCEVAGMWIGLMIITTTLSVGLDVLLVVAPPVEGAAVGAETAILSAQARQVAAAEARAAASAANAARLRIDLRTAQSANPAVESLRATGRLPSNYVTKDAAESAGWAPGKALNNSIPGAQIGGDRVRDPASIGLPTARGRTWYEADIGLVNTMKRSKQEGTRLLYSNDGMAYVTPDHYNSIYRIPNWK